MTISEHVAVVGGGVGGLAAAIDLASRGVRVSLFERQPDIGGKMRTVQVAGRPVDAGPTVLTMAWVFRELFERSGAVLDDYVRLEPSSFVARHAWADGSRLDLHTDELASAEAIGQFAGAAEARGFRAFLAYARRIHEAVRRPFLLSPRPTVLSLVREAASLGTAVGDIDAHRTMHKALTGFFQDPRLQQLFGRYATYCGSSPYRAPATLNLIYHVEASGVWFVRGGMSELARAMRRRATELGVRIQCNAPVERIETGRGRATALVLSGGDRIQADAIVVNADANAVAMGLLGSGVARATRPTPPSARSLSALTLAVVGRVSGFPLLRHTVFFSSDYEREFSQIERDGIAAEPTVYLCAQDRDDTASSDGQNERILFVINAKARGESKPLSHGDVEQYRRNLWERLHRLGLGIQADQIVTTTPTGFEHLFPATGGALYGRATHGPFASLARPGARTTIPGLYLAGGSVHPGAGVPMAGLSGWLCAQSILHDLTSGRRRSRGAIAGPISMG